MDKQIEKIYETLQKLVGYHRQLLDAVRLERDALVQADLRAIQETTCTKQALIQSIQMTETERLGLVAELAMQMKKRMDDLTLPNLVIEIQGRDPKGAELLRSTYNALTILIRRVSEQNQSNKALVEKSLEHIQEMKKNVLGEAVPRSDTYDPRGNKNSTSGGARLISKEA